MQSVTLKNILLVDDDIDHLCLCSRILSAQNFAVRQLSSVDNLSELLETVRDFQPDLIFMDHCMPGIGGFDAIKCLKSHILYRHIPIIYFSGEDDVVALATSAGADNYLRKRFYVPQLLELARKYTA